MISVYNFPYLLRTTALELKPNAFIETGCKTLTVDEMIGYIVSYTLTSEQEKKIKDRFGITSTVKTVLPDMTDRYNKLMKVLPEIFKQYKNKLEDIKEQANLLKGGSKNYYFEEEKLLFSNYTNMDKIGYIMSGGALTGIEQLDDSIKGPANQVSDLIDSFGSLIDSINTRITTLSGTESQKIAEIDNLNAAIIAAKEEGERKLAEAIAQHEAALKAQQDASDAKAAQAAAAAASEAAAAAAEAEANIKAAKDALANQKSDRASDAAKFAAILGQLKSALETKKSALEGLVPKPTTGGAILKGLNNLSVLPKIHSGGMDAGKLRDNYHKIKSLISKNNGVYSKMIGGNPDMMNLGMQGINNYSDMRNLMAQSLGMTQQPMPMNGQQMIPALFQQYSNQLLQNDPLRAAIMQQIPAMKFQ